jgi:hypothetical protein
MFCQNRDRWAAVVEGRNVTSHKLVCRMLLVYGVGSTEYDREEAEGRQHQDQD